MLITRTPLRLSIGGGGCDLPSYYRRSGATLVSAAIDKYCYIGVNRTFVADYLLKYSALERVTDIDAVQHPLIREALRLTQSAPGLEIVSMADIPSGTGLGSSGTFLVGLLRALHAVKRQHVSSSQIAEEACRIEIDILDNSVGKQDQYVAAFGGINCYQFNPDDTVDVTRLQVSDETIHRLDERLLLFFTGYARSASAVLDDQRKRSESGDASMWEALDFTADLGMRIKASLEEARLTDFAALMHEHWEFKAKRSPGMTNSDIDRWYRAGRDNGALGGKLVGAGAGGFLLFYTEEPNQLRAAMEEQGLTELRFKFDFDGSIVHSRG